MAAENSEYSHSAASWLSFLLPRFANRGCHSWRPVAGSCTGLKPPATSPLQHRLPQPGTSRLWPPLTMKGS